MTNTACYLVVYTICVATVAARSSTMAARRGATRRPLSDAVCIAKTQEQQLIALCVWIHQQRVDKARIGALNPSALFTGKLKKPHFESEPQVLQEVKNRKIEVFSAYFEARPEASGPAIRIVAVGWQAAYNTIGKIYCTLWYEDRDYAIAVGPAIYEVIYPSTVFHKHWSSHFILCPLPRGVTSLPYAVAVTDKQAEPATNHLLVLNRQLGAISNTHALCISALYNGFNKWRFLVEMFELHKLLGASAITIYDYSSALTTQRALHSYARDTDWLVTVVPWRLSERVREGNNVFCQRAALNDCFYRSAQRHRYVTVTDLDEVLMPRVVDTWPRLMKRIGRQRYGEYLFQHSYFRRNASHPDELVSQTSFWRPSEVTPPGRIRSKAMYDASKAVSIDLHSAFRLVAGASDYVLPPDVGMLHHYRSYAMEIFAKHPERYTFIEDRHAQRYGDKLQEAFDARVKAINIQRP